jgi:hypothetical protein
MSGTTDRWPDELDEEILAELRAAHDLLDPPPAGLDERVSFAIALERVEIEVARVQQDLLIGSGARSAAERTRTITFDSESLTIMVSVAELADGLVRLDGWLAPAAGLRVELRLAGAEPRSVRSDEGGRFVFDRVAHGLAQLVVHADGGAGHGAAGDGAARDVVTPSLVL